MQIYERLVLKDFIKAINDLCDQSGVDEAMREDMYLTKSFIENDILHSYEAYYFFNKMVLYYTGELKKFSLLINKKDVIDLL